MRLKRLLSLGGSCTFGIAAGGETGCPGAPFRGGRHRADQCWESGSGRWSLHGLELGLGRPGRPLGRAGNGKGMRSELDNLDSGPADGRAAAAPARGKMAAGARPLERGGVRLRGAPRGPEATRAARRPGLRCVRSLLSPAPRRPS